MEAKELARRQLAALKNFRKDKAALQNYRSSGSICATGPPAGAANVMQRRPHVPCKPMPSYATHGTPPRQRSIAKAHLKVPPQPQSTEMDPTGVFKVPQRPKQTGVLTSIGRGQVQQQTITSSQKSATPTKSDKGPVKVKAPARNGDGNDDLGYTPPPTYEQALSKLKLGGNS